MAILIEYFLKNVLKYPQVVYQLVSDTYILPFTRQKFDSFIFKIFIDIAMILFLPSLLIQKS